LFNNLELFLFNNLELFLFNNERRGVVILLWRWKVRRII